MVEPWLRGTHTDGGAVQRAVVHALEQVVEDLTRWTEGMDAEAMEMEPLGLPSVGFQMRHIARSLDRLTTYARGEALSEAQMLALQGERAGGGDRDALVADVEAALRAAMEFVLAARVDDLAEERFVGRAKLPTTLGGLLVHMAEHTQRHVGQAITTAKVVVALREAERS